MNQIIPFIFDDHPCRTVMIEDNPWWIGKDVCQVLGYQNHADALNTHCRGVAKRYPIVDSLGRKQEVRIINEGDMFRLIVASRQPRAQQFEKWLFEEVLPQIRKTGSYGVSEKRIEAVEGLLTLVVKLLTELIEEKLSLISETMTELMEEKRLREVIDRLKRRGTPLTPGEKGEIREMARQGYNLGQIRGELHRGRQTIRKALDEIEAAADQLALFDNAASRQGGAV